MPPSKRDSSQLGWHYKTPEDEELRDKYECFPEEDWKTYFQAAKESTSLPPRKVLNPNIMRDEVKKVACDDCSLPYQSLMRSLGKCHPIAGAVTPRIRAGLDD